jgi:CBS domain-containing protein
MRCDELMATDLKIMKPGSSVADAARVMRDANVGFLPICDDSDALVGVLTDRDITVRVVAEGRPASTPLEEVMTEEVVTCRPDDDLERAEELMRVNQKARVVVVDEDGQVAGVLSYADIAQYDDERRAGEVLSDITEREANVP